MKYGSLMNVLEEGIGNKQQLEVGMGVTLLSWSDRRPATIFEVSKSGKSFKAREDFAKRVDTNGMSECQDYEYTPNENGSWYEFKQAKNGRFYTKGGMANGQGCVIGHREKYYDYSF